MRTQWYLTFGAMALPIGFTLLFLAITEKSVPHYVYYIGEFIGAIGIISFIISIFKTKADDVENKNQNNKVICLLKEISDKLDDRR